MGEGYDVMTFHDDLDGFVRLGCISIWEHSITFGRVGSVVRLWSCSCRQYSREYTRVNDALIRRLHYSHLKNKFFIFKNNNRCTVI